MLHIMSPSDTGGGTEGDEDEEDEEDEEAEEDDSGSAVLAGAFLDMFHRRLE